jgi:hypothetical protein
MIVRVKNSISHTQSNVCARMFLDFNGDAVEFVDDNADVVLFDSAQEVPSNSKIKICVDFAHASEDKVRGWSNVGWINHPGMYVLQECYDQEFQYPGIISYDFIWNRSKAYYTNKKFTHCSYPWYYDSPENYLIQDLSSADKKTRIFLSANKLHRSNAVFRQRLVEMLSKKKYNNLGYLGASVPDKESSPTLHGNHIIPHATTVKEVVNGYPQKSTVGGFTPVHNAYYNETFLSVYGETFEYGTSYVTTEKTLNPLLKGHFVLPFANAGFIRYVKSQGWQLPNFIDYSYDSIDDDNMRFNCYCQELDRLLSISMDEWCQHWVDNLDILYYNRNQLHKRDYDRVDLTQLLKAQE